MTVTVVTLGTVLAVWMLICGWCGYRMRFVAFLAVLLAGLALNLVWMVFGLGARPFEVHAVMAQTSVLMYALSALGTGWLVGRLARDWRASRVE